MSKGKAEVTSCMDRPVFTTSMPAKERMQLFKHQLVCANFGLGARAL